MLLPFSLFCAPLCRQSADTKAASRTCAIGWSSRRAPTAACRTTSSSSSLPTTMFLGKVLFWAPPATLTLFSEGSISLAPFLSTQKELCFKSLIDIGNNISGSLLGDFFIAEWENKIMLVSVQNVGYQQYWFGAKGWCYTMNWTPKPSGFAYNGKDPFPPVRSWWFQLLKPARGLLSVLIFVRTLFVLHFSFSFSVGEIMWRLFISGIFKIIFYTVGVMLKITEVPRLYHSHERMSCTTTVFVTILYQKLWVWFGFLYLSLTYSLILTFICECDTNIAFLLLPWFSHLEYTHPGLSQNSLNLKEIIVTSFGILMQMPCEFWVSMKSWLCRKPTKEKLQIFNFIKFPAPSGKIRSFVCQVPKVHVLSSGLLFLLNGS